MKRMWINKQSIYYKRFISLTLEQRYALADANIQTDVNEYKGDGLQGCMYLMDLCRKYEPYISGVHDVELKIKFQAGAHNKLKGERE